MTNSKQMTYSEEYESWDTDPEGFWIEKAKEIDWYKFPENSLSHDADGLTHWFADGQLNTCYLALDYHVENGRGSQTALIYDSPVTASKKTFTYEELQFCAAKTCLLYTSPSPRD